MSGHRPTSRKDPPAASVRVWRGPDGLWSWRYREPGAGEDGQPLELLSNKHYTTRELAIHSATTAYPDVPLEDPDASRAPPARRRRRRLAWRAVLAGFLVWWLLVRPWWRARRGAGAHRAAR